MPQALAPIAVEHQRQWVGQVRVDRDRAAVRHARLMVGRSTAAAHIVYKHGDVGPDAPRMRRS